MDYKYFFVYGSLMEGFWNYEKVLKNKVIEKKAVFVHGTLYHLKHKGYPALLKGQNKIYG